MSPHRRRLDVILDPGFVDDLPELDLDEVRSRKQIADEVETELSYYRRLLHGRLDLLAFELRRRAGEETRSLIEALPDVLGGHEQAAGGSPRIPTVFAPDLPETRRRNIDRVLDDDFLSRLPSLGDEELVEIKETLIEAERGISESRRAVQKVADVLHDELIRRYKEGVADLTII